MKKKLKFFIRFLYVIRYLGPFRKFLIFKNRCIKKSFICSDFTDLKLSNTTEIVHNICENGYCIAGSINKNKIEKIKSFCTERTVHNPHLTSPLINDIVRSLEIYQIVKEYLGSEPILYSTLLYKRQDNIDTTSKTCSRDYHFDVGDYKAVTLFIYLTDVDENSSPHVVIKKTHKIFKHKKIFKRYLTVSEAKNLYFNNIVHLFGNAGTIILEDISCYHKRALGKDERMLLSATYHISRVPSSKFDYIKKKLL